MLGVMEGVWKLECLSKGLMTFSKAKGIIPVTRTLCRTPRFFIDNLFFTIASQCSSKASMEGRPALPSRGTTPPFRGP
ncbi:hypothetical protein DPMN_058205, partial [Dreissena polymorpha]